MTAPTLPTGNNNNAQLPPQTQRISPEDGSVVVTWRKSNTNVTKQTSLTPTCGAKKYRFDALSVLADNSLSLRHLTTYTMCPQYDGFFDNKELTILGTNRTCELVITKFMNGNVKFTTPDLSDIDKLGNLTGLLLYDAFESWICKDISRIGIIRTTKESKAIPANASTNISREYNPVSVMEHTLRNTKAVNDLLTVHIVCSTSEGGLISKYGMPLMEINKKLIIAIPGLSDEQKIQAKVFLVNDTSTEIVLRKMMSPNRTSFLLGFAVPQLTRINQKLIIKFGEIQYESTVCLYTPASLQEHSEKYAAFANIPPSLDTTVGSPAPATPDSANCCSWTVNELGNSVPVFETTKTQSPKTPGTPCTPSGWFDFVEKVQKEKGMAPVESPKTPETPSQKFFSIPSTRDKHVESKELKRKTDQGEVFCKSSSEDEKKKTQKI